MNTSPTIGALATAMALMQAEIENVTKDRVNTFFAKDPNSKPTYATLAAVLDVCRPALAKHDLSVVQVPGNDGQMVTVTTRLMHKSGEWMESTCGAVPMKPDAQQFGSVVTYLRRYSLASLCAVTQDDDDGNAASAPQSRDNGQSRSQPAPQAQTARTAQPRALDKTEQEVQDVRDYIVKRLDLIAHKWNGKDLTADAVQNRVPPSVLKDIRDAIKIAESSEVDRPFFDPNEDLPL